MKNLVFLFSLLFLPCLVVCHDWILLGEDPSDDLVDTDYTDIFSASYYIKSDSIYFLLTCNLDYFPFEPEFGIAIGIDTNLIADDGLTTWGGMNQSMHPDHQKIIVTNNIFPDILPSEIKSISENKDSLILQFQLHEIDNDGIFNVLFGTGIYNLTEGSMVYDEAPNVNNYSIDMTISSVESFSDIPNINIYPNPTYDFITINDSVLIHDLNIFDLYGRKFHVDHSKYNNNIDVSHLLSGQYLLIIQSDGDIKKVNFIKL